MKYHLNSTNYIGQKPMSVITNAAIKSGVENVSDTVSKIVK